MPEAPRSDSPPTLILIGLRASGKTTLAREIAALLGDASAAIDLDDVTPSVLGESSVAAAFTKHGEPAFRAAEFKALSSLLAASGRVIALGGGTPTAPGAAALLRNERDTERCVIVYLRSSAATLRARLKATDNTHRPALTLTGGGRSDVIGEVDQLFAARDPLYRDLASLVIDTSRLTPAQAAAAVLAELQLMGFRFTRDG